MERECEHRRSWKRKLKRKGEISVIGESLLLIHKHIQRETGSSRRYRAVQNGWDGGENGAAFRNLFLGSLPCQLSPAEGGPVGGAVLSFVCCFFPALACLCLMADGDITGERRQGATGANLYREPPFTSVRKLHQRV
ncbi:hypothetical protein EGW08_012070 [Elysia chlorotica]|uniref:Uncharacterized protein n=1 Tax=Elysia chlorotica TaxID=188477 RepID=A0A433TF62_ELYCH|nr:hypothetical protein EGW08_012070 [Elysia chlorotica]